MIRKKTILVIDDLDNHFAHIKEILHIGNFAVLPLPVTNENFYSNVDLIKAIRTIYDIDASESLREDQERKLRDLLNKNVLDGFIIDYELEHRKENCSGINFYNNFIDVDNVLKNLPVLFLTGKKGIPLNKVHDLIRKINDNRAFPVAYFMSKDKFQNKQFNTDLMNKINDIFTDKPQLPKL